MCIRDSHQAAQQQQAAGDHQGAVLHHDQLVARQLMNRQPEHEMCIRDRRGKEHIRLETQIVIGPRGEPVTARVRAQYLPELQEVEVVSRAITQMKVTLPESWLPAKLNWNGTEVANATAAGCWLLDEQKELLTAKRCQ